MHRVLGILAVTGCVIGGYLIAGGELAVLVQPAAFIIIVGAAVGAFIMSVSRVNAGKVRSGVAAVFRPSLYNPKAGAQLLQFLYHLSVLVKREGVIVLEDHIQNPAKSPLFSPYPLISKNRAVLDYVIEALTLQVEGAVSAEDLETILKRSLDTMHAEDSAPAAVVSRVGDALPGLGIVAASLGIIVAMGHIEGGPEVVATRIAGALVGTFLGMLLSCGFVGPLAAAMEQNLRDRENFFEAVQTGMVAFAEGKAPTVIVEMARRALFSYNRPERRAVDRACKALKVA